ncbi:hypothetical protein WN55_07978 [Dufourea novaeangliae]|uniref:Uncharacterized protein n=1 Tax=Dufourea novaeangliae TaxID=178035 RepID=A0A154P485_DUFNO|nr:hypothetical protein WN55_07978 [Dufourea novaeangliae]
MLLAPIFHPFVIQFHVWRYTQVGSEQAEMDLFQRSERIKCFPNIGEREVRLNV